MTPASWQPDPTGRHQFRWWDGASWTDHVSDNGQASHDPLQAPAAPEVPAHVDLDATVARPAPAGPPTMPTMVNPAMSTPIAEPAPSSGSGSGPTWWKIALPILAVVAVGAVLFAVIGGGDDEGSNPLGVTEAELTEPDQVAVLRFSLNRGDVIRIRVEAENAEPEVVVIGDDAAGAAYTEAIVDLFTDSEFSDFVTDTDDLFTDIDDVLSEADLTELGGDKRNPALTSFDEFDEFVAADFFASLADGNFAVVVASSEGEDELGKVRIIVEQRDEPIDEDTLTDFSEADSFFSDGDDDFFSDEAFYSDTDEFTPN